jgi:hypothetical protein
MRSRRSIAKKSWAVEVLYDSQFSAEAIGLLFRELSRSRSFAEHPSPGAAGLRAS